MKYEIHKKLKEVLEISFLLQNVINLILKKY